MEKVFSYNFYSSYSFFFFSNCSSGQLLILSEQRNMCGWYLDVEDCASWYEGVNCDSGVNWLTW